jgi:malate synthase
VTMTVPFMRAYTELLVKTCHRRGAHAMGGMAAFIPSRRDPKVNEVALPKVREDKLRESGDGFDGTWVAHPDLVPIAMEVFEAALRDKPNQVDRQRDDVQVSAANLLEIRVPGGQVTEAGLRTNINVGIQYTASWLRGIGAAAINNLMEDAATAEISRSQVWQWVHHGIRLAEGPQVTAALVRQLEREELDKISEAVGAQAYQDGRFEEAARIFEQVALSDEFTEFLTIPAYDHIDI